MVQNFPEDGSVRDMSPISHNKMDNYETILALMRAEFSDWKGDSIMAVLKDPD